MGLTFKIMEIQLEFEFMGWVRMMPSNQIWALKYGFDQIRPLNKNQLEFDF